MFDDTRSGNADVDDGIGFRYTVKCSRHEGIVIGRITEDDQFGASDAVALLCHFRGLFDDLSHDADGVHVDAGFGGADIYGSADMLGFREHLRDGLHEVLVGFRHSFGDEGRKATEEIDAGLLCALFEGMRDREVVLR